MTLSSLKSSAQTQGYNSQYTLQQSGMWSDSRRDFLCKEMESSGISQPVKLTNVNAH